MRDDTARPQNLRSVNVVALEQRMLLDAAAVQTAAEVIAPANQVEAPHDASDDLAAIADLSTGSNATTAVFIDTRIENYQQLLQGIDADTEVFFIDGSRDGIQQMLDALEGSEPFQSIQIYSHGGNAQLQLGSTLLTTFSVDSHAADLQALGSHLVSGGDLLLFGCNVAADTTGKQFIDRLAALTGADVAASEGMTGSPAVSGNWELEYAAGDVTAQSVIDQRVQDLFSSSLATGWTNLGGGTLQNSDNANNDEFGWSLAVADTTGWIVTGGYAQADIYAYRPTGAGEYQEYKITPPTTGVAGSSVDVDGNFLIVGYASINTVHIYEFSGGSWVLRHTSTGTAGTNFGADVAIQADGTNFRAAVGASAGQGSVSTIVSTNSGLTWTKGTAFTTNDGDNDASLAFGTSVALDGNHLVVGATGWGYSWSSYGGSGSEANVGRAYVYDWAGNVNIAPAVNGMAQILQADGLGVGAAYSNDPGGGTGGGAGWQFGRAVDISVNGTNRAIAVGSPYEGNGEVYIWTNQLSPGTGASWTFRQDVFSGAPPRFGYSVGIDAYANRLVVGAWGYDNTGLTGAGNEDGRVFGYQATAGDWTSYANDVVMESNDANSRFGWAVGVMRDIIVGGSPWFGAGNKNGFLSLAIENSAVVAVGDSASITESQTATINVRANDTEPNNATLDPSLIIAVTDPTRGTVSIVNNEVVYNPNGEYEYLYAGQVVTEVLQYTVQDGGGELSTGTITITITGQNDPVQLVSPTPVPPQVLNVGGTGVYNTLFVAGNPMSSQTLKQLGYFVDVDVDPTAETYSFTGGTLSGTVPNQVSSVTVVGNLGHSLTFTINTTTGAVTTTTSPTAIMLGEVFTLPTIVVNDNRGSSQAEPSITVTIERSNTAPTTVGTVPAMQVWEDNIKPGTYSQSGMTITVTSAAHGLQVGDVISIDFKSGTASDSSFVVGSVTANTFTVTALASATTSGNLFHGVRSQVSMTPYFNDTDSGETLTYSLVGAPSWLSISPMTGALQFFGTNDNVTGAPVGFTVRVTDEYGRTADQAVTVTLNAVNDAPVVTNEIPETQAFLNTTYNNAAGQALVDLSTLAPLLFSDIDNPTPNTITLSASFNDGTGRTISTVAPGAGAGAWIRFDPATGRFYSSGAVTGDAIGTVLSLKVTATDNGTPFPMSTDYFFNISVFAAPGAGGYVTGTSPTGNNQAGYAVAVSEDGLWMAVGEPRYDAGGNDNAQGRVSIYNWSGTGWTAVTTLVDPSPASFERFGYALDWSVDGTRLVIGAPGVSSDTGTVYSYTRTAGTTTFSAATAYTASAGDNNAGDQFGFSVALNRAGTQFVVGAPGDNAGAGAVYLFNFGTAAQLAKQARVAEAGDLATFDYFGYSVDFDGNLVVVGSPFDSTATNAYVGSATVLGVDGVGFGTGTNIAKMFGTNSFDLFGWDVALDTYRLTAGSAADSSITLVVGTPGSDLKEADAGAVYTYRLNAAATLTKTTNFSTTPIALVSTDTAYDGHAGEQFGISVAVDTSNTAANFANDVKDNGIRMVVGANINGSSQGSAYVYRALASGGWLGQKYLQNNTGLTTTPAENQFGWSVSVTNAPTSAWNAAYAVAANAGRVVVGAPNTDQSGVGPKGAVYTASTAGSGIETAGGLLSGSVDKTMAGGTTVVVPGEEPSTGTETEIHLLPEKRAAWQPGYLLSAFAGDETGMSGVGAAPVSLHVAGDAASDPLLLLLLADSSPAVQAVEATTEPEAGPSEDGGQKPAGEGEEPAAASEAGNTLSQQLRLLGARHQAQAKDFLGQLASLGS